MKIFDRVLFLFILMLSLSMPLRAQEPSLTAPENPDATLAPESAGGFNFSKKLKLGAELISYRYVEPGLIEHVGFLTGVNGQFQWTLNDSVTGIADASFVAGKLDYNGSLCNPETNSCSDYSAKTADIILRLTHRFDFIVNDSFHVFAGPGLRYLFDRGDDSGFYTRLGLYLFAPVGFTVQFPLPNNDQLFLDLEYDLFISGSMESKLSEANSKWNDMTHRQSAGSGHRITLGYGFNKQTANPCEIALYYENWDVDDSSKERLYISGQPSNRTYFEPKNFSQSIGAKIAIFF